jgi:hypothetical protein
MSSQRHATPGEGKQRLACETATLGGMANGDRTRAADSDVARLVLRQSYERLKELIHWPCLALRTYPLRDTYRQSETGIGLKNAIIPPCPAPAFFPCQQSSLA